jgi:hypothetical protein
MSDDPDWFASKRYGWGSGLPIKWQGWVLLVGYMLLLGIATFVIRGNRIGFASVAVILTAIFSVIAARTTKGGWRWRWGEEE